MSSIKAPLKIRLQNSLKGIGKTFRNPAYIVISLITTIFISGFIIWSLNFDLVRYIAFEAPLSLLEKFEFFWDVHTSIFTTYGSSQASGILIFSILFGINIALIVKLIKMGGFKSIPKKSGSAGLLLAVLGGGCIACGTSILAPLLATLGATTTAAATEISNYFNWIGSVLILYSIYKLGYVINNNN